MAWKRRPLPKAGERCADPAKAREKALDWLCGRELSSNQLYDRLRRYYTDQAAAEAVAYVVQQQFVDDRRFARNKARQLYDQHRSRRSIAQTLAEKGIDRALAAQVLDELYAGLEEELTAEAEWAGEEETAFTDPETAAAAALIEKSYRRKLEAGRPDLVLAALQRRGFSYRAARAALAACQEEQDGYL